MKSVVATMGCTVNHATETTWQVGQRVRRWLFPYQSNRGVMTVPTLILVGDRDDWTPAQARQDMAAHQNETGITRSPGNSGAPVTLAVYPGAIHTFDDYYPEHHYLDHLIRHDPAATHTAPRFALRRFCETTRLKTQRTNPPGQRAGPDRGIARDEQPPRKRTHRMLQTDGAGSDTRYTNGSSPGPAGSTAATRPLENRN